MPHPTEWDASSYHRLADPQFVWGLKVLDRLDLRGDELVVDAGCGSGRLTEALLGRLPRGRVIAVDRSENMLREAARTLAHFGDRVRYLREVRAQDHGAQEIAIARGIVDDGGRALKLGRPRARNRVSPPHDRGRRPG